MRRLAFWILLAVAVGSSHCGENTIHLRHGTTGTSSGASTVDDPILPSTSLFYPSVGFTEDRANDGSISQSIALRLFDDNFYAPTGGMVEDTHYRLTGTAVPQGLTLEILLESDVTATIGFSGQAVAHAPGDSVFGISVFFLDAAFKSQQAPSDGTADQAFSITFTNAIPFMVLYSGIRVTGGIAEEGEVREKADSLCKQSRPAGISQRNVRAFISIDKEDQIANLPKLFAVPADVEIQSLDGHILASDWAGLLDGRITFSLAEAGVIQDYDYWWSGSNESGEVNLEANCKGFQMGRDAEGVAGQGDQKYAAWMNAEYVQCEEELNLLCLAFD